MGGPTMKPKEETLEKWGAEVLKVYESEADTYKMYDMVFEKIRKFEEQAKTVDAFDTFLESFGKDSMARNHFLLMGYALLDDPKKLEKFVKNAMGNAAIMKEIKGATASTMLKKEEAKLKEAVGKEDSETIQKYNDIVEYMGKDELSKVILTLYLSEMEKSGDLKYGIGYVYDKSIGKELNYDMVMTAEEKIRNMLKKSDIEAQKKTLEEKFEDLMDPKSNLLNEKEKTLFLNISYRLALIEPHYAAAFVGEFYDIALSEEKTGEAVYRQMLGMMESTWGDPLKEYFQNTFEHAEKIGMPYTTKERIMLMALYNYSFMEAFGIKPPHSHGFIAQLFITGVQNFGQAMGYSQKQALTTETYAAISAARSDVPTEQEPDATAMAKRMLYVPLLYAAGVSAASMLTFTAEYFVNWLVSLLNPGQQKLVERLTLKSLYKGALPDPFSVMEYGAAIAIVGEMYKRTITDPKLMKVKGPLNVIIGKGLYNKVVDYREDPEMAPQLWRLLLITVQAGLQHPKAGVLEWADSVTSYVLKGIEKGKIKNAEDLAYFVDALYYIANFGGYNLADVVEAVLDETGKKFGPHKGKSLKKVVDDAKWLAFNEIKITSGIGGTLRKVDGWKKKWKDESFRKKIKKEKGKKWYSAMVPKKEEEATFYAKLTPKKAGGAYA